MLSRRDRYPLIPWPRQIEERAAARKRHPAGTDWREPVMDYLERKGELA